MVPESAATKRGTKRAVGGRAAVAGASDFPWLHELVLSSTTDQTWPSECLGGHRRQQGSSRWEGWWWRRCGLLVVVALLHLWACVVYEGRGKRKEGCSVSLCSCLPCASGTSTATIGGEVQCPTLLNTIEGGWWWRRGRGGGTRSVMVNVTSYGTKGVQRHKA